MRENRQKIVDQIDGSQSVLIIIIIVSIVIINNIIIIIIINNNNNNKTVLILIPVIRYYYCLLLPYLYRCSTINNSITHQMNNIPLCCCWCSFFNIIIINVDQNG